MTKYWIGVASRDHVNVGTAGGFCQLCHGKAAPLRRLKAGDRIICYSPRERMCDGEPIQAFTGIGEVAAGEPEAHDMGGGFVPYRRSVTYYKASDAPIQLCCRCFPLRAAARSGASCCAGASSPSIEEIMTSSPTRWARRSVKD
jgi:hypothetical protein